MVNIKKLLMKQYYIEMNDMKLNRNTMKKHRVLTMDGKIIESRHYLGKSHDIAMENDAYEDCDIKMKKNLPEEHLLKLCKYLAGKTEKHHQLIFRDMKKSLDNNFDENNIQINQSMLCSYNREVLYPLANGIIKKALIEFDKEVEVKANIKGNERLFEIPLNGVSNHDQQQLQQSQQQLQQQEQNKRDILLKIRQQIFERKRLRSKLYQTTTQVWRPW